MSLGNQLLGFLNFCQRISARRVQSQRLLVSLDGRSHIPLCKQEIARNLVRDGEIRVRSGNIVQYLFGLIEIAHRQFGPGGKAQQVGIARELMQRLFADRCSEA